MNGTKIKEILVQRGVSQSEMARELGMSQQSFNQMLNAADIKTSLLERIAAALGVPESVFYNLPDVLVGGAPSAPMTEAETLERMTNENSEKLRKAFENLGLTQKDIARVLDVDPAYINKLLNGKKAFGRKTAQQFQDLFGISAAWLLTGEGNLLVGGAPSAPMTEAETRPRIPTTVAAGSLAGIADSIKAGDCEQRPIVRAFPNYDCTIIVKGDSMEPEYKGGDEIAIRKVTDFIEWGKVYVLDTREGAVLKRLYDDGESFRCVSFNSEYKDFNVLKESVFAVYKVVGLLRV